MFRNDTDTEGESSFLECPVCGGCVYFGYCFFECLVGDLGLRVEPFAHPASGGCEFAFVFHVVDEVHGVPFEWEKFVLCSPHRYVARAFDARGEGVTARVFVCAATTLVAFSTGLRGLRFREMPRQCVAGTRNPISRGLDGVVWAWSRDTSPKRVQSISFSWDVQPSGC